MPRSSQFWWGLPYPLFQGFSTTGIWDWIILCCEMFTSIPGPSSQNTFSVLPQLWQQKMSPDFTRYPLESKVAPGWQRLVSSNLGGHVQISQLICPQGHSLAGVCTRLSTAELSSKLAKWPCMLLYLLAYMLDLDLLNSNSCLWPPSQAIIMSAYDLAALLVNTHPGAQS